MPLPVLVPVPFPSSFPQQQASNSLSMEPNPEFAALGAFGLAGICRETLRVARSRPAGSVFLAVQVIVLTLSLLAHIAVSRALFSDALASSSHAGAGLLRLDTNWTPFFLIEAACLLAIVAQSLGAAAFCVFCVAPRYGVADDRDKRTIARDYRTVPWFLARFLWSVFRGDSRSATRLIRTGRKIAWRLVVTTFDALLLLLGYTALLGAAAWMAHHHLLAAAAPGEEESGALLPRVALLLGGAAYLAGAAHIGAVWRVACLMLVLEDNWGFRGMHISDELLAGKYWATAPVFWTTDCCVIAVQLAFGALVVDDRMGLRIRLRVAAGVVMAAVLWAAVMAGLVAQVVVYLVCKSYHRQRESLDVTAAKNYLANVGRGRATPTSRKRRQ